MIKHTIRVPMLNANEPEANLVDIHVSDGQSVEKGTRLFTIETTKATSDIESPQAGFIHFVVKQGATLSVGDLLGVITDTKDEKIEINLDSNEQLAGVEEGRITAAPPFSEGKLRITKPARALAESFGLDLNSLPIDRLVTENDVRQIVDIGSEMTLPTSDKPSILIYGAGGHAKSVLEMILQLGMYSVAGILDDDSKLTGNKVLGIPVLGTRALLPRLFQRGVRLAANGVGGIVDITVRVKLFKLLENAGFSFPAVVNPRAVVEPSAVIGEGVQVFANAYIGSEARLHPRCMINTNSVVSHDCIIAAYTHIAPGALLAGHVHVGERSLVGMGVTTTIGVKIGDGVRIGNGAIILADVPDGTIIQAGRYWTGKVDAV